MQIYNYNLDVSVNDEEKIYKCHEVIKFNGNEEKLILNSVDLKIIKLKINGSVKNYKIYDKSQEMVVDGIITKDSIAEIDFTGKIPQLFQGFYLSKTKDGEMFTTQFESTGARRFFVCIDNPSYKATFDITVSFNKKYSAISNMPVQNEKTDGEIKTVKFMQTPPMSTYLLYLGIGEFESRSLKFDNNKEIILAAQKGHLTSSDYPLEIAKKAIEFYENYFNIKYPLPKEHLVSVPEFAAGAMENWGALTFREIYLNISSSTGAAVKKSVGEVIAHELAHQWFGDLVTMIWWDDLWLNESFATFMSYLSMDALEPSYDMFSDFLISETFGALEGDSLLNSHPIEVEVKSPDDISQIFDEISYGKGGSILRMIHTFVTDDVFKKGLNQYLNNFSYKNASGSDLWEYLTKVSDLPVREVMESFITRMGYPLIEASIYDNKILLKQSRFLLNGKKMNSTWNIPLTVKYKNRNSSVIFASEFMEIEYIDDFLKLNENGTGFYRVLYSDELYSIILKNTDKLSNKDILGIVNDLHAFFIAGKITLEDYISKIKPFMEFNDPFIAMEISNSLYFLYTIAGGNKTVLEENKKFHKEKLDEMGDQKEGESINISLARGVIASRYAAIDEDYAKEMSKKIEEILSVDPNMRNAVLISYALTENNGEKLLELIGKFDQDEDRVKAIQALGYVSGKDNFDLIRDAIATRKIKSQDSIRYYISASINPAAREYIYKELENIINSVQKVFEGSGYSSRLVESLIPYIGLEHKDEIAEKMKKLEFPEISRGIKKGLEYLEIYTNAISKMD